MAPGGRWKREGFNTTGGPAAGGFGVPIPITKPDELARVASALTRLGKSRPTCGTAASRPRKRLAKKPAHQQRRLSAIEHGPEWSSLDSVCSRSLISRTALGRISPIKLTRTCGGSIGFLFPYCCNQAVIQLLPIDAMMHSAVAIGTQRSHEHRIVGAAIAKASNVMRF
jgi:hypothetical protein